MPAPETRPVEAPKGALMSEKTTVDEFVAQKKLALVGVSRTGKKYGNNAYRELKARGYQVYAVHPGADTLEGDRAYPDLASLPEKVDGLVIIVHPDQTEIVVRQAAEAGIARIWMQPGSESVPAIQFCEQHNLSLVHGECILMYAAPEGFHKFHGRLWKLLGKAPR